MKDVFIDLANQSGNDEAILSLYRYQLTIVGTHLQPKMVWSAWIATWRVYRLLQAATFKSAALRQKYNCPFAIYCCSAH